MKRQVRASWICLSILISGWQAQHFIRILCCRQRHGMKRRICRQRICIRSCIRFNQRLTAAGIQKRTGISSWSLAKRFQSWRRKLGLHHMMIYWRCPFSMIRRGRRRSRKVVSGTGVAVNVSRFLVRQCRSFCMLCVIIRNLPKSSVHLDPT